MLSKITKQSVEFKTKIKDLRFVTKRLEIWGNKWDLRFGQMI